MAQTPSVQYTARDFQSIRSELESLVRQTRPKVWSDFFAADLGITLIELVAASHDTLSYGQDAISSEAFLATARRYETALRHAQSLGYKPRAAGAATVDVTASSLPQAIQDNGGVIRAGTSISATGGGRFELTEDHHIPQGNTSTKITLKEGRSREDTFEATGQPDQQFTTEHGVVEDGSWEVFVGPVSEDNRWTEVDSVTFNNDGGEVYETRFTGDGRLVLIFGGEPQPSKAPSQQITVRYRTTQGADGNAPILGVQGTLEAEAGVTFNDAGDPIVDTTGTVISVSVANENSAATGGADREGLEELKQNVRAFLRSLDKLISFDDYENNIQRVAGGDVAMSFIQLLNGSYEGNHLRLNLWGKEDVTFTSETPAKSLDPVESDAAYTRFSQISVGRTGKVREFVRDRAMLTVTHEFAQPGITWVDLYLSDVLHDSTVERKTVHKDVTAAVVNAFETSAGMSLRLMDLYDAIDAVPTVEAFNIDRMVVEQTKIATLRFNAQPSDGDTVSIVDEFGANKTTFEFDNDNSTTHTAVTIGSDLRETLRNFQTVVENAADVAVKLMHDNAASPQLVRIEYIEEEDNLVDLVEKNASNIDVLDPTDDVAAVFPDDRRRDQTPLRDRFPVGSPDNEPSNYDAPSGLSAGAGSNSGWQDVGFKPYRHLKDIVTAFKRGERHFYNEEFLYNNEIYYDSVKGLNERVQAINLRRLVMDVKPKRR